MARFVIFPWLGLLNSQAPGVETDWRGSVLPRALRRYWTGQVVDWWRTAAA